MSQKVATKFYCKICDYSTSRKNDWLKHVSTRKHKILANPPKKSQKVAENFLCGCGRFYKHRQSLKYHQKKCKSVEVVETESSDDELESLSKKDLLNVIKDLLPKLGSNITNHVTNNVTNNNINIQLFLDNECKDAMTIQGFATQLSLTLEDLLKGNKPNALTGVSNIVIENLKPIPLTERPIHCTDIKKRTWHVNDAIDGWKKEDGLSVINQVEFNVSKRFQALWDEAYPNWKNDEKLQQHYTELVVALNSNPSQKDIEKALERIGPECQLSIADISNCQLNFP